MPLEIRKLIRKISIANPLWGAPRIHGELLKLGIDIGQTSVAKYMATRRGPPSQGWKAFLSNHADGIATMDPCSQRIGDPISFDTPVAATSNLFTVDVKSTLEKNASDIEIGFRC